MSNEEHPTAYLPTYTGKYFDYHNPTPEMVCLADIAHALSNICRFGGHTKRFYSVAEHCVLVSHYVPLHRAAEGLLHDAAEAYYGDVVATFKSSVWVGEVSDLENPAGAHLHRFKDYENVLLRMIFKKYGLPWPLSDVVKQVDKRLFVSEHLALKDDDLPPWVVGIPELKLRDHAVVGHLPSVAEQMFLGRALVLGIGE